MIPIFQVFISFVCLVLGFRLPSGQDYFTETLMGLGRGKPMPVWGTYNIIIIPNEIPSRLCNSVSKQLSMINKQKQTLSRTAITRIF